MTAWDRFHGATLSLARSGTIKERLSNAYRQHLAGLQEEELPRELRDEFRELSSALRAEPPLLRGEDAVQATIRKLSSDEAERLAGAVIELFCELPRSPSPVARHASGAQIVPLYLAEA